MNHTTYKQDYCKIVEGACKLGATDMQVADMIGVTKQTILNWRAKHPEFAAAFVSGKALSDDAVERSLFARAMGYEHEEVDIRVIEGQVVQTPIRKHYPPDTVACIFWLKNRRPDVWREKREQEADTNMSDVLRDLIQKLPG